MKIENLDSNKDYKIKSNKNIIATKNQQKNLRRKKNQLGLSVLSSNLFCDFTFKGVHM